MPLDNVLTILWRDRQLLEPLHLELEEEQLLLAGRSRWLARAADDFSSAPIATMLCW